MSHSPPCFGPQPPSPSPAPTSKTSRARPTRFAISTRANTPFACSCATSDGGLYGGFSSLADALAAKGDTLAFAMNAGMYAPDYAPVGLYVESGRTLHGVNTAAGEGNFHMKPNGVFWVDGARAGVTETARFLKSRMGPAYATQSGPMLVVGGRINPHIHESGASEKYRNGVCVTQGHVAHFAISNQPVTFYRFALAVSRPAQMFGRAVSRRRHGLGDLCAVNLPPRSLPSDGAADRRDAEEVDQASINAPT